MRRSKIDVRLVLGSPMLVEQIGADDSSISYKWEHPADLAYVDVGDKISLLVLVYFPVNATLGDGGKFMPYDSFDGKNTIGGLLCGEEYLLRLRMFSLKQNYGPWSPYVSLRTSGLCPEILALVHDDVTLT